MKNDAELHRDVKKVMGVSDIFRLTNTQIQNIIDYVNDQVHKTITIGNDQNYMTLAETISSVIPQISRTSLIYDRTYFCNKTLDQYPNLYREFSSENFDYYGITDDISCGSKRTCLLCSLDHDDEESIEDAARNYFSVSETETETETKSETIPKLPKLAETPETSPKLTNFGQN
uniref:Uncharacterized protein n=1 Tax=Rhizophagus irregularis (strain DAOM 181602 / DAOM 197198 / MUCL 43194) TaxID=747089 RepID=U9T5Z0_RHIID